MFSPLVMMAVLGTSPAPLPVADTAITPEAIAGAWELVSGTNDDGSEFKPEGLVWLMLTADGHYCHVGMPAGRAKVEKKIEEMSKDELLARYQKVFSNCGRYTVAGGKMTRQIVFALSPSREGTEVVREVRLDGKELVLKNVEASSKAEGRFRRRQ